MMRFDDGLQENFGASRGGLAPALPGFARRMHANDYGRLQMTTLHTGGGAADVTRMFTRMLTDVYEC
jgi:hypothetical protein